MAAAYAAVVSLVHLMEQIHLYHTRHPIFLEEQQVHLESLHKNVILLQDFLENYSHGDSSIEAEYLESRITEVTYAAEDLIESYIVDDIQSRSVNLRKKSSISNRSSQLGQNRVKINYFSQGLQNIVRNMDFINKEIAKIKIEGRKSTDPAIVGSLRRSKEGVVVVFEDDLNQMLNKLTTNKSNLQVIPITGMGGIGKTTLARNVYVNSFVVQRFDIRGWITLSQEYNLREILLGLLQEIGYCPEHINLEVLEYHQLGLKLYKYLSGRRYLIVIDDMWSITSWDKLRMFFPDNNNESRIVVTTRLSNLADCFGSSDLLYKMNLLNESKSWNLFCRKVFVQESCPPELEEIGKQIARNCKGLPLSISVVGGLLANSKMTRQYWEYIVSDTNTIINLEDNERCFKILSMSYNYLPVYLKPCFLYLGIFPEDREIRVSKLIKLWVAEGFLKPSKLESMEEVAENYLKNLIDRNLIFVSKWGSLGHMKYCKIHDLLRDLCLREAEKKRFLCVDMVQNPKVSQDLSSARRIVIHHEFSDNEYFIQVCRALRSASLARSLTCNISLGPINCYFMNQPPPQALDFRPPLNFKLLRMLDVVDYYPTEDILQLVNARYICASFDNIPSSICMLWNLQTLIIKAHGWGNTAPPEIWEMTQLRHLMINTINLPDPLGGRNDRVLKNLQTLSEVSDLRLTEEILGKIPNIKKLKLRYRGDGILNFGLNNLGRLLKLQSLQCTFGGKEFQNLEFPLSLKKLTLTDVDVAWKDIKTKVELLPNLEKLKLIGLSLGEEWNPVEGQFPRLKYLEIYSDDLVYWRADETHFPCLEHLVMKGLHRLEEIPSGIGDVSTLQSIRLGWCSSSAVASAKKILKEQRELGNESFRLLIDEKPIEDDSNDEEDEEEENS